MQLFGNKTFCTVQTKPTPSPPQQGSKAALLSALRDTASLQPSPPLEQACGNIYSSLRGPYIPPALDRSKCPEEKAWREAVKGVKNRMGVSLCLLHKRSTSWGPRLEQQREEELPASPRAAIPFCFQVQRERPQCLGCKRTPGLPLPISSRE